MDNSIKTGANEHVGKGGGMSKEFTRDVSFDLSGARDNGDGLTFEGYAAVFDSPTRINSWEGEFDEVITRGAFAKSLRNSMPVLMFDHGHHPLIGSMPLGVITDAREDAKGLFIQARLTDNWLIQPVRDAVRDGALTGMSFRFTVPEGGEQWQERKGNVPLRTLTAIDSRECGPVVFPAYAPTTASVRHRLDEMRYDPESVIEAVKAGDLSLIRAGDSKKPYGDVTYADPGYQKDGKKRYPLDTATHVKAAWSYINMDKNASAYTSSQLATIKGRIKSAAKKLGIEINDSGTTGTNSLDLSDDVLRELLDELMENNSIESDSHESVDSCESGDKEELAGRSFTRSEDGGEVEKSNEDSEEKAKRDRMLRWLQRKHPLIPKEVKNG